ncbi:7044_t:CDS:1 [Funneliformis caledonium]|uniref:7044_t:CDS:1 n=1 Tax=Funneliformis caledonium TaxID=1117310 RepID=A0A9N9DHF6_9GLOM|nr:7044_t:CDS:1 [Funneliformis caledonium]
MNSSFTEKSFSKKQKTSTNNKESPILKKLIKELKILSSVSTNMQPPITNSRNLTKLYEAIIIAKNKNRDKNQVVIMRYYLFGKELKKFFDRFKSSYRDHKIQRMLVKEITKQLSGDLSKNAIEKK